MKLETLVILAKMFCFIVIGAGTPTATALAQWANSGEWPQPIQWVLIAVGALVGGCTQLLSFLSNSYDAYLKEKKANGGTQMWKKIP